MDMNRIYFSRIKVSAPRIKNSGSRDTGFRKGYGLVLLLLMSWGRLSAQPYLIQGNIEHAGPGKIYLASYYGDHFSLIDSLESGSGSFHFFLSDEAPAGIYRLIYSDVYEGIMSENRFIEFIYNHQDVSLNVALDENGPFPSFDNSLENRVYFEFMNYQIGYERNITDVYSQLYPGPEGDETNHSARIRYDDLQIRRLQFMDSLSHLYPGLYATRIMNAFRVPVVSGSLSHRERIDTLKQRFFEDAPINDPALLHAPVYTFRIVDYLSLYAVDTFTFEQQEDHFIEAVDRIMDHVAPLPELKSFVVEFMLEGFELLDMEKVQLHLAENYLDESCESDVAELVRERMEGYRQMLVGATAPDFTVMDLKGDPCTLSALPNPYVLVMFWASTCEHCREMIPDLSRWYREENNLGLEIVAISIDSSAVQLKDYLAQQSLPWITIHDPLGWLGRLAEDYYIYATPTMFLLNDEREILSKPSNFRQFQRAVKKLGD